MRTLEELVKKTISNTLCFCIFDSLCGSQVVFSENKDIVKNYSLSSNGENEKRTVGFPVIYEIRVNVSKQRNCIDYGVHCCFYLE